MSCSRNLSTTLSRVFGGLFGVFSSVIQTSGQFFFDAVPARTSAFAPRAVPGSATLCASVWSVSVAFGSPSPRPAAQARPARHRSVPCATATPRPPPPPCPNRAGPNRGTSLGSDGLCCAIPATDARNGPPRTHAVPGVGEGGRSSDVVVGVEGRVNGLPWSSGAAPAHALQSSQDGSSTSSHRGSFLSASLKNHAAQLPNGRVPFGRGDINPCFVLFSSAFFSYPAILNCAWK